MNRILLFAPLALLACSQPEPVFTDVNDVREAIMQVENVQFQALMNNDVEASNSHWSRDISMQWIRSHTANDSTFDMAWNLKDAFIEDGDTTAYWSHLWANEVTYTQRDSTILQILWIHETEQWQRNRQLLRFPLIAHRPHR